MTSEAARAIEAILMVAQEPIDPHLLAQLLEVAPARVEELCTDLQAGYAAEQRGFVLARVAGGYRFQSHGDLAPYVERFVLEGQSARLSAAALETLAIVAYKQPLSRAQVASIRGVNVDGVMRTLQQRGYVEEVGKDPGPGQATLFGTSTEFLERMGLDRIEDLPPIAALFPSTEVMEALERGLRADPVARADQLPLDGEPDDPDPVADVVEAEMHGEAPDPEPSDQPPAVAGPVAGTEPTGATAPAPDSPADPAPDSDADPAPDSDGDGDADPAPDSDSDGDGDGDADPAPDVETHGEPDAEPGLVEPAEPAPDWSEAPVAIPDDLDDLDAPVAPLEEPSWARRDREAADVDGDGATDLPPAP